jgi:hypothetical protein
MTHCSEDLNRDLPDSYVAQIDERISLVKAGTGRADYLAKRDAEIDQAVNLVEIDLRSSGRRLPMQPQRYGSPVPAGLPLSPGDRDWAVSLGT